MSLPVLPNLPPRIGRGKADRLILDAIANARQEPAAANNKPRPFTYGEDEFAPDWFIVRIKDDALYVAYMVGEGPIEQYVHVTHDGIDVGAEGGFLDFDGAQIEYKTGESDQTVSTLLQECIPGFTDTYPNTAFFVVKCPRDSTAGIPIFSVRIKGLKLYDRRKDSTAGGSGSHRIDDQSTWEYSECPALALDDFIRKHRPNNPVTGSVAVADSNDESVGGQKRRLIGWTLRDFQPFPAVVEVLRAYAGCFVIPDGINYRMVPDRPSESVITFDEDSIESLRIRGRSLANRPTRVEIEYRHAQAFSMRSFMQSADTSEDPPRVSVRRMPGIHRASQAKREAEEILLWSQLCDKEVTFDVFDEGLKIVKGSVVTLNHSRIHGGTMKVRVMDYNNTQPGCYSFVGEQYSDDAFSDATVSDPTFDDADFGSPLQPPNVTGLNADEELFTNKDGRTSSRLRITWDHMQYAYLLQYVVTVTRDGVVVWAEATREAEIATSALEQLVDGEPAQLVIRVRTQTIYTISNGVTANATLLGKLAPPGDVPNIAAAVVDGDTVNISWGAAVDIDLVGYHLKVGTTGQTWEQMTTVDKLITAQQLNGYKPSSTGTLRFRIKAVDSVGNESENDATATATLSAPAAPTSLSGKRLFNSHELTWSESNQKNVETELWASSDNNRSNAVLIDRKKGKQAVVERAATTYYWVRNWHPMLGTSAYFPSGSTAGVQVNVPLTAADGATRNTHHGEVASMPDSSFGEDGDTALIAGLEPILIQKHNGVWGQVAAYGVPTGARISGTLSETVRGHAVDWGGVATDVKDAEQRVHAVGAGLDVDGRAQLLGFRTVDSRQISVSSVENMLLNPDGPPEGVNGHFNTNADPNDYAMAAVAFIQLNGLNSRQAITYRVSNGDVTASASDVYYNMRARPRIQRGRRANFEVWARHNGAWVSGTWSLRCLFYDNNEDPIGSSELLTTYNLTALTQTFVRHAAQTPPAPGHAAYVVVFARLNSGATAMASGNSRLALTAARLTLARNPDDTAASFVAQTNPAIASATNYLSASGSILTVQAGFRRTGGIDAAWNATQLGISNGTWYVYAVFGNGIHNPATAIQVTSSPLAVSGDVDRAFIGSITVSGGGGSGSGGGNAEP
jgi:hypothetical protein